MIRYLLDTCVISDFAKGEACTLNQMKQKSPSTLAISTISTMEIEYGLQLNSSRAAVLNPIISDLLLNIQTLPYSEADAHATAAIRAHLKKRGLPIGPYDILLAGCALSRGLILVSANTQEFQRIIGLQLENWRSK